MQANKAKYFLCIVFLLCFLQILNAQNIETGVASFYHDKFIGRKTANGEIFSQEKFTAAHKTLPLGTWVRVTNLSNDSVVIVRINDRMPLWNKRSIDLTRAAAGKLNYINSGVTRVKIEIIPAPQPAFAEKRPKDLPVKPLSSIKTERIPFEGEVVKTPVFTYVDLEVYTMNLRKKRR